MSIVSRNAAAAFRWRLCPGRRLRPLGLADRVGGLSPSGLRCGPISRRASGLTRAPRRQAAPQTRRRRIAPLAIAATSAFPTLKGGGMRGPENLYLPASRRWQEVSEAPRRRCHSGPAGRDWPPVFFGTREARRNRFDQDGHENASFIGAVKASARTPTVTPRTARTTAQSHTVRPSMLPRSPNLIERAAGKNLPIPPDGPAVCLHRGCQFGCLLPVSGGVADKDVAHMDGGREEEPTGSPAPLINAAGSSRDGADANGLRRSSSSRSAPF